MFKKNIITSNVKYSRDILANFYKFNPYSTTAIKNCLNRYLNSKQKKKNNSERYKICDSKKLY